MTKLSFRSVPGLNALRDNPDLWATAVLVLVLAAAQTPFAAAGLKAHMSRALPLPAAVEAVISAPLQTEGPLFRITRISNRIDNGPSVADTSLDEWAARLDRKKERLWKRLEDKMRRLEERIEKHETRIKSQAIATREE